MSSHLSHEICLRAVVDPVVAQTAARTVHAMIVPPMVMAAVLIAGLMSKSLSVCLSVGGFETTTMGGANA